MNKEFVRELPLFAGLSDEDLERLFALADTLTLAPGEVLVREGEPGDAMFLALEGQFEVSKRTGERDVIIAGCGPGDVIGEISLLEGAPRTATVRAFKSATLVKISRDTFRQLLQSNPDAALRILRTVIQRLRNTEQMLQQSEKMAALGTLAAGLAHELNNPAAAVKRGAELLRESLGDLQRLTTELAAAGLDEIQTRTLAELRRQVAERAAHPVQLDPLGLSDREEELRDWLETRAVENSWEIAPALVALGWDAEDLQQRIAPFGAQQAPVLLCWLSAGSNVYSLLDEVGQGAERISDIVRAVKSYSYLDQAPVQVVDVHEGLENTLTILRHKLKQGVTVHKDYAPDLPRIEAYASELNQVWTNIIDNAIDAMKGHGELWIRTGMAGDQVTVEIANNGPEIPESVRPRIFDAFFTTKQQGQGTGLGLNITYNIVRNHHHGDVEVMSDSARTAFRITLPVHLPAS